MLRDFICYLRGHVIRLEATELPEGVAVTASEYCVRCYRIVGTREVTLK